MAKISCNISFSFLPMRARHVFTFTFYRVLHSTVCMPLLFSFIIKDILFPEANFLFVFLVLHVAKNSYFFSFLFKLKLSDLFFTLAFYCDLHLAHILHSSLTHHSLLAAWSSLSPAHEAHLALPDLTSPTTSFFLPDYAASTHSTRHIRRRV